MARKQLLPKFSLMGTAGRKSYESENTWKSQRSKQSGDFSILSPNNVRRLSFREISVVQRLKAKHENKFVEDLFGYTSPREHISNRFITIGTFNNDNECVGLISLDDHPNVPVVPPWEWYHWVYNLYGLANLTTRNTLFIHYAIWEPIYILFFLSPILQKLFETHEELETIIWVCPPGITAGVEFVSQNAKRVLPKGFVNHKKVQTLFLIERENFACKYTIRRAVEEDNDDLVAINPQILKETYGPYYVSELIRFPEETGRQLIVAEYNGCAVGMLCLNKQVNYDLLNAHFELVPFNGLKKPNIADEVNLTTSGTALATQEEETEQLYFDGTVGEVDKKSDGDETQDVGSDDEYSLANITSSLFFNFLYGDDDEMHLSSSGSGASIESRFSAVILNEDYQDHLYSRSFHEPGTFSEVLAERKSTYKRTTKVFQDMENIPQFHGQPNAFALEICEALRDHEAALYQLFQAAFKCYPGRDYCVVSFPASACHCYIVKHFARVCPRTSSLFPQQLYLLHRNAILGTIWLRVAHSNDKKYVNHFIMSISKCWIVEEQFREAVDTPDSPLKAYLVFCEQQLIGLAILSEESEHEYLHVHYALDMWVSVEGNKFGQYGSLDYFFLSPIFQRHQPFILRELHRLSNFSVLFCHVKRYEYMFSHKGLPLNNAIIAMPPVLPSPVMEYNKAIVDDFHIPSTALSKRPPSALFISCSRLTSRPRIEINHHIIVVGSGDTALAFLESLLFTKNFKAQIIFSNVTVVSPHGLSYHKQPNKVREMLFVSNGHIDRRYMESLCLKSFVHIVTGAMSSIDRRYKIIGLSDDTFLSYDYLFLLCGEQFQKPNRKMKEQEKKKYEFPTNAFIVNTEADASNALTTLKNLLNNKKSVTIVVYGHYLESLCTLEAIKQYGVKESNLVYVDPPAEPDNPLSGRHDYITHFFNNKEVEQAVFKNMVKQGITVYQDYSFVDWHQDSSRNIITSARFESKYKFIELDVTAIFFYCSKTVSARTYQAIHKSGLIFNGKLVINKNNMTNDENIYAAGPLTMYSAKYHASHLMHRYFNTEEIGFALGQQIRRKLIPTEFQDDPLPTRELHKPLVQYCRFPGDLQYLKVFKPGKPVPLDIAMNKGPYGRTLITGDCTKLDDKGYFRLHLNQHDTVETITCLSKEELNIHNLISLYGKHETLLNNLQMRYDMKNVTDFFEFFKEPWACAIYHPKFMFLYEHFNDLLNEIVTPNGQLLVEDIRAKFENNDWEKLTKLQHDEIDETCRDSGFYETVKRKLIDFLHENHMYLPMYVFNTLIVWIMHEIQRSPLFVRTTADPYERKILLAVLPF